MTRYAQREPKQSRPVNPDGGFICPECESGRMLIRQTRQVINGISRRRVCRHCSFRLTTIEKIKPAKSSTAV